MNRVVEFFDEHKNKQVATIRECQGRYYFEYNPKWSGNTLDPSIPLSFAGFLSDWQMEGLMDKLPVKSNPRYAEYCQKWGIDHNDSDHLTLLCTIGHRTISNAICRPIGWLPGVWNKLIS